MLPGVRGNSGVILSRFFSGVVDSGGAGLVYIIEGVGRGAQESKASVGEELAAFDTVADVVKYLDSRKEVQGNRNSI